MLSFPFIYKKFLVFQSLTNTLFYIFKSLFDNLQKNVINQQQQNLKKKQLPSDMVVLCEI